MLLANLYDETTVFFLFASEAIVSINYKLPGDDDRLSSPTG
jgi:hypothetical protein